MVAMLLVQSLRGEEIDSAFRVMESYLSVHIKYERETAVD